MARRPPPKALSPRSAGVRASTTWPGTPEAPPLPSLPHDVYRLVEELEKRLGGPEDSPPSGDPWDASTCSAIMDTLSQMGMNPEEALRSLWLARGTSQKILRMALAIQISHQWPTQGISNEQP